MTMTFTNNGNRNGRNINNSTEMSWSSRPSSSPQPSSSSSSSSSPSSSSSAAAATMQTSTTAPLASAFDLTSASTSTSKTNSTSSSHLKDRPHRKSNHHKHKHQEWRYSSRRSTGEELSSSTTTSSAGATTTAGTARRPKKQHIKFHSSSCEVGSDIHRRTQTVFDKIDSDTPQGAQRLVQRQKQINKGKNTVGYDEYCRRVPKNLRRPRCMDTPSTPDYTLDIPNRQWNGMVKAWRIALHKYDPKDLQEAFSEAQAVKEEFDEVDGGVSSRGNANKYDKMFNSVEELPIHEQELAQAKKHGLLDLVEVNANTHFGTMLEGDDMSDDDLL